MPPRLQRALIRGGRADFWRYAATCLVLQHPGGREAAEVPVAHLADDAEMERHYQRLGGKSWVSRAAIEELRAIAAGTRR